MNRFLRTVTVLVVALALPVAAAVARAESGPRAELDALVARVRRSDPTVDFDRLRRLSVQVDTYAPDTHPSKPLYAALTGKDYAAAKRLADAVLAEDYLDVDAHFVAAIACTELGDRAAADHHVYVVRGTIDAILGSGDGRTPKTAMFVRSVAEEYVLARVLELRVLGQRLDHSDGHSYDVVTVKGDDDAESREIYFDIDAVWAAEQRRFGSKPGSKP